MPKPKKIINNAEDSVSEFIDGLLLQYPNRLRKLQNHHVVLARNAAAADKVHLISGGGSGHEPSHAGWLDGNGMLSGAVCGGIFASPSVSSILAAIRAVVAAAAGTSNNKGVLLVIKNYTGDRLNFGMAAERAAQEGVLVDMVVVADDCALPRTKGITGARGVAGTVVVHKIAGAAAASGKSLQEVKAIADAVCRRMGTLGASLDSVTIPGADTVNDRLDEKTIEIGLGIHGEAGMRQSPLVSANELAKEMVSTIQKFGRVVSKDGADDEIVPLFQKGDEVCVLVNNLGGTSNFEMSILARSCVRLLESDEYGVKAVRVMVGSLMTSFDMHGASLTVLNTTGRSDLTEFLDAPTNAPAWQQCDVWDFSSDPSRPSCAEIPEVAVDEKVSQLKMPTLAIPDFDSNSKSLITAAVQKLAENEPLLTKYDTIVGDGDCGITMKRGATEVLDRLGSGKIPTDHPVPLFSALADAVSASMGGTSGVLLELMFRKMSSTLSRADSIDVGGICASFQAGAGLLSVVPLCDCYCTSCCTAFLI